MIVTLIATFTMRPGVAPLRALPDALTAHLNSSSWQAVVK